MSHILWPIYNLSRYYFYYFKAINERDKELRSALVTTSTKQIGDICNLTEKYLLEDDDRVAYSGKDFLMTPHHLWNSCSLAHQRVVDRAPPLG